MTITDIRADLTAHDLVLDVANSMMICPTVAGRQCAVADSIALYGRVLAEEHPEFSSALVALLAERYGARVVARIKQFIASGDIVGHA